MMKNFGVRENAERIIKLRSRFTLAIFLTLLLLFLVTAVFVMIAFNLGIMPVIFGNPFVLMIVIYVISTILATLVAIYINRTILTPIERLSEASKKVAKGNFDVRLDVSDDTEELNAVFANFNKMAEDLTSIETLRNDFVANVSHEFKTPLSAIEGYVTLLQDPNLSEEERAECTQKILINTRRLSDLTGNILLLSKLENQSYVEGEHTFRLDEQIREVFLTLEQKWTAKQLELELDELPDTTVCAPEGLLLQVWMNIIGNAVKFTEEGGTVSAKIADLGDRVSVTVRDTGIGIDESTLGHIFDKFYQGDTSHRIQGNGLGLALCREIVEKCGGTISVESEVGRGSAFTVVLPKGC